eukprot:CAMPEP_0197599474 /NCGR_PEP_ID=MMETSP1326-20131121/31457_1 /TAXON_ID=1155430 /ORGANISM="Genus nov. species nov., Strain RCC2288" /LENGTH=52 /DNA_ID=CAMNT_0043166449 /DNA_START=93 /DNA_END=251 /DNA_ORIENTATION=+
MLCGGADDGDDICAMRAGLWLAGFISSGFVGMEGDILVRERTEEAASARPPK